MYNYAKVYYNDKNYDIEKFDITTRENSMQMLRDIRELNELDKEEFMNLCKEVCEELPF